MKVKHLVSRLLFFLLLSYGFFYFSYKWLDPTQVNTDFIQYYGMVLHPMDFHAAPSPWVYRQLTTLCAAALVHLHIYYPNQIQFHSSIYDQHVFFGMMLTNYLGVIVASLATTFVVDDYLPSEGPQLEVFPLFAGMLCFFSFYLQETTITGQADGMSWALLGLGYLFYRKRFFVPFFIIMAVSIFQREILPLVFLVFSTVHRLTDRGHKGQRDRIFLRSCMVSCAAVFACYLLVKHCIHAPGNEYQTNMGLQLRSLLGFRLNRAYVSQVFIGQNLIILMAAMWFILWKKYREISPNILAIALACGMLVALSIVANISNNAGRMVAMLTPIVAVEITTALMRLEDKSLTSREAQDPGRVQRRR